MSALLYGKAIVFSPSEIKPIIGLDGKLRLRLRPKRPVTVTQRTATGVKLWTLKDCGDHWEPFACIGENHTPSPQP